MHGFALCCHCSFELVAQKKPEKITGREGQYALKQVGQFGLKQVGQFTPKWVGQYGVRLSLRHLSELFGEKAPSPTHYEDKVWIGDLVLGNNQIIPRPHQYNGHPLLLQSYFNEKLFFAGTETSTEFAGYMEGAVRSAERVAQQILKIKG